MTQAESLLDYGAVITDKGNSDPLRELLNR